MIITQQKDIDTVQAKINYRMFTIYCKSSVNLFRLNVLSWLKGFEFETIKGVSRLEKVFINTEK